MSQFLKSLRKRASALVDKSAWFMIVPSLVLLWLIDASLFETILEWLIIAPLITGFAVMLSRCVFPHISLCELVDGAREGNKAAGIVVAGLMIFCGLLILALMLWARA